jgi:glutaredoxin
MCGIGIDNFSNLLQVISSRTPVVTEYTPTSKFFVYIKNYCHFSKATVAKLVAEKCKELSVFDLVNGKFMCPEKFTFLDTETHSTELMGAWSGSETVPQIFVQDGGQWGFLAGGNTRVQQITVGRKPAEGREDGPRTVLKF